MPEISNWERFIACGVLLHLICIWWFGQIQIKLFLSWNFYEYFHSKRGYILISMSSLGFWGTTDGLQNLSHKISQSRGYPCSGHNICDTPAVNLVSTEWLVCPKFVNLTKYFNFYAEIRWRKDKLMQKECRRISTWRMVWLQRWLSRCSCNEGGHFDPCLVRQLFMILFLISEFS